MGKSGLRMSHKQHDHGNFTVIIKDPIHACGSIPEAGCAGAIFSTHGVSYSQVFGRVGGYQKKYHRLLVHLTMNNTL